MELNICTWNISFGNQLQTLKKTFKKSAFKKIDIIALQETSVHSEIEDSKYLAEALGVNFASFQVKAQISKKKYQGNGFIWNTEDIKILKTESVILPDYKSAGISKSEYALKHILPKETRNCVIVEGIKDGKKFRIYNTHFDMIGFDLKRKQLLSIMSLDSDKKPADLVLIAGDFNTFRVLKYPRWKKFNEEANRLGFYDITDHIEWTFHRKLIRYRQKLDIIFLKKSGDISHKTSLKFYPGSDHFPVFASLKIKHPD
jgi:endonuclease/exonuclease/phosphatase family metal-dependent hydrolase